MGTGDRLAGVALDDEALEPVRPRADHHLQGADPNGRVVRAIVLLGKRGRRAGDEKIKTRLHVVGHGETLRALLVVGGRRQGVPPRFDRLALEQCPPILLSRQAELFFAQFVPVGRHEPEVRPGDVAVRDGKLRPRRVPDRLRLDGNRLGLNLRDEVVATVPAPGFGECIAPGDRHAPCLHGVAVGVQRLRPVIPRPGRERPRLALDQRLHRLDEAIVRAVTGGDAFAMQQSQNVGVVERRRVGVVQVKPQHVLIQSNSLELGRLCVGCLRYPREKLIQRAKQRVAYSHFKRIFRLGRRELAGRVKTKRLVRDEVVQRRPVMLRQGRLGQQVGEVGGGNRLEPSIGEGVGEVQIDLAIKPGQIPRREIVAERLRGGGALQEAVAVHAEVLPVPVAEDGLQQRPGLGGRLLEFGPQACDFFLRLVALHRALVRDALGQGLDRLRVLAVPQCRVIDQLQPGRRRFWQPLFLRGSHLLPQRLAVGRLRLRERQPGRQRQKNAQQSHHP